MVAIRVAHQGNPRAKPVDHRPGQAVFAPHGHFAHRAVEHIKHLLHILVYVKFGVFLSAFTFGIRQQLHLAHFIHAVVLQTAFGIGDHIIVSVFPYHHPGADGVQLAFMTGHHLLLQVPVTVFEPHLVARGDGAVQGIHAVKDLFLLAFHPAGNQHLAVQLLLAVAGGEPSQLFDQHLAFARGNELAGIHSVHQQFQLCQFKRGIHHIIPAPAAALLHDLKGGIRHFVQGLDIVIHAFALCHNAALFQQFYHARHTDGVLFVGFPHKNFQQRKQL